MWQGKAAATSYMFNYFLIVLRATTPTIQLGGKWYRTYVGIEKGKVAVDDFSVALWFWEKRKFIRR